MALLGPISEFFHMCECCSVLPNNNRKRFRPFLAKSNDSNSINSLKTWFLLFPAVLGTFLALLGIISEFCHRCECCSVLPYNTKKRFRQFPAKSNDSNWIRSPRSMFLHFIRFFPKCQRESKRSQKGVKIFFSIFILLFFLLRMTEFEKKRKIFFLENLCPVTHRWWPTGIFGYFGHFWPNTNFPGKSDSATFYPSYSPNFMQRIRKN